MTNYDKYVKGHLTDKKFEGLETLGVDFDGRLHKCSTFDFCCNDCMLFYMSAANCPLAFAYWCNLEAQE